MKLTPQVEMESLRAYEQVRAFERLRSWRLPLSYVIFAMIPMLTGVGFLKANHPAMGEAHLVTALLFVAASCYHWNWLLKRYTRNLRLLGEHKNLYGDQLPWVQVEKHLDAMDKLKRELAQEKIAEALKGVRERMENEPDDTDAK